jgi:PAS domain S-box-containing protein
MSNKPVKPDDNSVPDNDLRRIESIANFGSGDWDITSGAMTWSPEAGRILGLDPPKDEVSIDALFALVHPDDRERVEHALGQAMASGNYDMEHRIIRPDGSVRFIHTQCEFYRDAKGQAVRALGVVQDVTDRRYAEYTLAQAQAIAHFGSWDWDIVTGALTWSDEIYRIFGLRPQEFGATYDAFLQRIHPDDREAVVEAVNSAVQTGAPYSIDHRIVRPDGTIRYVHETGDITRDKDGTPLRMLGVVHDISDRKKVELELRLKHNAVESSINAVAMADLEGRLSYVNDSFLRHWGYESRAEVLGRSALDFWQDPDDAVAVIAELQQNGIARTEMPARRKDGSVFMAQLAANVVMDSDGNPICMMASFVDVTERLNAETELRDLNETLERRVQQRTEELEGERNFVNTILDTSGALIVVLDHTGRIVRFNRACETVTGYRANEILGSCVWDRLLRPQDVEEVKGVFRSITSGRYPNSHDNIWVSKDRAEHMIAWSNSAVSDETGAVRYVVGTGIDITERRAASAALDRFRAALDASGDGIYIIDRPSMRFIDGNKAAWEVLGYTRDELLRMGPHNIKPGFDRESLAARFDETLKEDGPDSTGRMETVHRRKDGTEFPVDIRIHPAHIDGRLLIVAIVRDVTEQREAENELRRAKTAAETANAAKSEFLSRMSHELRTPLNAILGFGQLLELEDEELLSDTHRDYVREIVTAGNHLLSLVNEVLDLARVEAGRIQLDMTDLKLDSALQEIVRISAPLASQHGISLRCPPVEDDVTIYADAIRLRQIILNLISNAVKYNRDNGSVTIAVSCPAPGRTRIAVSDTGPGIPLELHHRLFEPFDRLNQSHSEGTGIGLTVSKQLVELMGGRIGFDSKPGAGSTFWIELRSRREGATTAAEPGRSASSPREKPDTAANTDSRRKILYVEDNPANLRLVQSLFGRRPDITLLAATTGEDGLEAAREHRPDLLLIDINLPGMSGYDLLRELRQLPDFQSTPAVALSANAMPDDLAAGKAAGFVAYVTKPIDIEKLLGTIDRLLAQASRNPHAPEH